MLPFSLSNFIVLVGDPRTCKTFLAAQLALKRVKKGEPVKANCGLAFGEYQNLVSRWGDVLELRRAHDCVIIFDEGQLLADNRNWSELPKAFYDMLPQYGHRKLTFIFTTQNLDGIDVKIRRLAEAGGDIIYCNTIRLLRLPWDIRKPALFQISTISRFPFFIFISKLWNKKIYDSFEDTNLEITKTRTLIRRRKVKATITGATV